MNNVILSGRVGQDPTLFHSPSGTSVTKFTLATSEYINGEQKTTWHNIVTFGKTADNCSQYLKKGSQAIVNGRIEYSEYEDKNGVQKIWPQVIAARVEFIFNNNSSEERRPQAKPVEQKEYEIKSDANYKADDIPF